MKYIIGIERDDGTKVELSFGVKEEAILFLKNFERTVQIDRDLVGEEWRAIPIEGMEDYQVSSKGRVRSIKNGQRKILGQRLRHGYLAFHWSDKGKNKRALVHRLVALAFIPNPHNYPQVNHKDFNRQNNCVENLNWCTQKQNNDWTKEHDPLLWAGRKRNDYTRTPAQIQEMLRKRSEAYKKRLDALPYKYKFTKISTGEVFYFKTVPSAVKQLGGQQPGYWAVIAGKYKQHNGYRVELIQE